MVINEMTDIKTPKDVLSFMDKIKYGYVDINGEKHINSLKGVRTLYRTPSVEDVLNTEVGNCIDQVLVMHYLLDNLNIPNKIFCTRVYESGDIPEEEEEHMHCFVLYYDDEGVHHIEHPDGEKKGIYHYQNEETAIETINKRYIEMAGGVARPVTELPYIEKGLNYREFNDFVNSLDEEKKL